ncbi:hypothetical protein [Nocardioides sp. 1609]|uniref:LVIVD repeat-containing protein n=1 Tax=Nocardioides sp. 1609 TaxID=2508327 RepID=UPI001FD6E69A|nr:hypothetical protein [Nocardioides sp. 1609]
MKLIVALGSFVLAAGLAVAPASADPDDPPALEKRPVLPGHDIARTDPAVPRVTSGQVDRSRAMRQVARVPLAAELAEDGAFGTDLAFKGDYAFAGNYNGFAVYDISRPRSPRRVAQVVCPGAQNDVSVYRNLLVLSVDAVLSDDTCNAEYAEPGGDETTTWEGIRVFDISDPRSPELLTSVATSCGSHTHTLAPDRDGRNVYVYVSSYGPAPRLKGCKPPHDSISVVKVPTDDGAAARVVRTPVLFPGGGTRGDDYSSNTSGCHDITAYPRKNLAAGACMGDGILLDITNRARPRVIDRVKDRRNFAFWHSATFNNAGTKVVFTDELGGGGGPMCNNDVGPKRGANGIYDIVRRELKFRSYYKMPRVQSDTENCVAHNGSLIPVKGRDIMVQAWYQGGTSVFDFTDSRNPRELQHFDRGAISNRRLELGGSWSSYWYNGFVYSSDITRGLEVFQIRTPWARRAAKVRLSSFNAQSQPSYNG